MSVSDNKGVVSRYLPTTTLPSRQASEPVKKASAGLTAKPASSPLAKRRVYVLHSGMSAPQNEAANSLKQGLMKRGVPERDIAVLANTYPERDYLQAARDNQQEANSVIYRASTDPNSAVAKDVFQRYTAALKRLDVKPGDEITWVGHSAGGQMGMTLSNMAKAEKQFPMDTLITLGSPIHRNARVPQEIKVRNYLSQQDEWVNLKSEEWLSRQIGVPITVTALHDNNDKLRLFSNIPHSQWYKDDRVLDRIITESDPTHKPDWQVQQVSDNRFIRWMGHVNQHLGEVGQVTLEGQQLTGQRPQARQNEILMSKQP